MPIAKIIRRHDSLEPLHGVLVGLDEAGRGPIAGPVVAAAVILDHQNPIEGLDDSKKLTEKKRETLSQIIKSKALDWAMGSASVEEIDTLNILQASLLAMRRALEQLQVIPDFVLIDGNQFIQSNYPMYAVVGGDARVAEISAASILAKTERDRLMIDLHNDYPQYGFDQHKGYPTARHLQALASCGITHHHRRSFAPVRAYL